MEEAERQKKRLAAGRQAIERNDPRAAEEIANSALRDNPRDIDFLQLLAVSYYRQSRFQEAIAPLKEVFQRLSPKGAGYNLGYCYLAVGDAKNAEIVLEKEVKAFPDLVESQNLLGISLKRQRRHEEALAVFALAIERHPGYGGTYNNMGITLSDMARHEEAVPYLQKAIEIQRGNAQAHYNLGNAYWALGRHDAAIGCINQALQIVPDDIEACNTLGLILKDGNRYDEAATCFQRALTINPGYSPAYQNLGLVLDELNRHEEAVRCFERALAIRPDLPETHVGLGVAYHNQVRLGDAVSCYRKAISLQPDLATAHLNLGLALQDLKRIEEAVACFQKVLVLKPKHKHALSALAWAQAVGCDWRERSARVEALRAHVRERRSIVDPFAFVTVCEDLDEQRLCAERSLADELPDRLPALGQGRKDRHEKIRVAYVSGDFREHAVAYCTQELFTLHDRSKFELFGVSIGVNDGSEMRSKLERSFDRFLDVRRMSDLDAARLLCDLDVDIAVDLMGHTKGSRPGIFARRPAPIQVSYLGYPGTMAADFIDYILADKFVLPEEHQKFYSEKAAYLPDCYQANDSKRTIAERVPARGEVGLPERGFVFCCFNNNYKIVPKVFDVWMRLLHQVPAGVLWLVEDNAWARQNLCREAQAKGIDPVRLIFMQRVGIADYRARFRLADLFLDTLPYTGHGTASDALWAGLPVLTCAGQTFAGRVAGSLLRAVGLPELVTSSLEEYEVLALRLAREGQFLKGLRDRLERNRLSAPLFDADRFRRHIESAYTTMWEIWQRGERPRTFAVAPLGPVYGQDMRA
jgi:predicted O-linked N-acetylglucosamine transferase (SPINDLY family)